MSVPRVEMRGGTKVLFVHDEPFIMRSGEVHNSSSSSAEYMEAIWDKADSLNLNSLLMPVSWELIEPEQGEFDFALVDRLILQAREHGKKIGFLWFGAWKNAQCYYAPAWVKTDLATYHRAQVEKGENFTKLREVHGLPYTTLSAFCRATQEADAAAFAALMRHIRDFDGEENTVVMVQVENETGLLGAAREHSDEADRLFAASVPEALSDYLCERESELADALRAVFSAGTRRGTWSEVFGEMAEEAFTAYYTASYVGAVARAGKAAYPLPMAANCWLDKGQKPGRYPTGGPVAKVLDIWRFAAPEIDMYAPDIYVPYFCKVCDEYAQKGNPLFIAECATHGYAAARALYSVGRHHAMCYAPFGIEDLGEPFTILQGVLFGMDTGDEMLKIPQDTVEYARVNEMLAELAPVLAEAYGTDRLQGAISEEGERTTLTFDRYEFEVEFGGRWLRRKTGACLLVSCGEDEFYVALFGCQLHIRSRDTEKPYTDLLSVEEGHLQDQAFIPARRLNGDETAVMAFDKPTLLRVKLFSYR